MTDTDSVKNQKLLAGLGLLVLSIVIVGTVIVTSPKTTATMMNSASIVVSSPNSRVAAVNTSSSSLYKNGSYSAVGKYYSPGGQESIKVSLSLNSDTVTNSAAKSGANDPTAISYQTLFISNYKKYVVGKKLNAIKISNVSGSSLTSQGFTNALKQIENQAKA